MSRIDDSVSSSGGALLRVRDLRVSFGDREVVHGVDLDVAPGETLAVVGESGSGKSVTARALLGLTGAGASVTAAQLDVDGRDLRDASARDWRGIRGSRIGLVSQDALVSLDPLRPLGREIADTLRIHTRLSPSARADRVLEVLHDVGMPDPEIRIAQRAGELSGGQRQRALIASALALRPPLLVADEPTTALDVTVQARILDLLDSVTADGTGLLLISHDLAVVARVADRIAVMSEGRVVETGTVDDVLGSPRAEETRRLIAAIPTGRPRGARLGPVEAYRDVETRPRPAVVAVAGMAVAGAAVTATDQAPPLLDVRGVAKSFRRRGADPLVAVDDVSLSIRHGETVGLVGESGSGKSTLARIALALTAPDRGEVFVDGEPWSALRESQRRPRRRVMGSIYQDALSSFDPRLTTGQILADALLVAGIRDGDGRQARELLDSVGLPNTVLDRRPARLSGGQRQRVSIARALAASPSLLVCDEPVSALDVGVQATVLDLLDEIQRERGLALLFISHDLGVVRHMSDRIAVMRAGRIVETGDAEALFADPRHAYTRELLDATPTLEQRPAWPVHGRSRLRRT